MTSYSKLNTHRECAQKYNYRYVQHLESLTDARSPHPTLGSWWHLIRAADSIDRGAQAPALLEAVDNIVLKAPAARGAGSALAAAWDLLERWEKTMTADDRDKWGDTFGEQPVDRLRNMDAEWRERWADDIAHETPLMVEVKFSRPLPDYRDPLTWTLVRASENLTGYIDEVYLDTRRQFIVVRDHKTHTNLDGSTSLAEDMDSQLHLYAWAATPLIREAMGKSPRAIAYDRVRSVAPKQPVVTKAGNLSKSVTGYSLRTYLQWLGRHGGEVPYPGMKKDGSGAGVYTLEESVVENLSDPASRSMWTQRSLSPLNTSVVKAHLSAATLTHIDSTRTEKLVEQLGEAPRTFTRHCKWCDFKELCRAQMIGGSGGEYDLAAHGVTKMKRRGRNLT